jgi:predicted nucleotidyltransferase component of viral defense system
VTKPIEPKRPRNIDPLGVEILERLHGAPAAAAIILGGNTALQHYREFRPSHDIDAWWGDAPSEDALETIRQAASAVALRHKYHLRERSWGDTVSLELHDPNRQNQTVFSFQIAARDVALDVPYESAWSPVKVETFRDNLGSKMNALVERGAPRDFVDVYEIVSHGMASVKDCWDLWQLKNIGASLSEAKDKVLHNMAQIEARVPLQQVSSSDREMASRRREFFRSEFLRN